MVARFLFSKTRNWVICVSSSTACARSRICSPQASISVFRRSDRDAALSPVLPGNVRLQLAHMAWTRALLLDDPETARALSPYLGGEQTQSNVQTGIAGGIAGSVLRGMFDK